MQCLSLWDCGHLQKLFHLLIPVCFQLQKEKKWKTCKPDILYGISILCNLPTAYFFLCNNNFNLSMFQPVNVQPTKTWGLPTLMLWEHLEDSWVRAWLTLQTPKGQQTAFICKQSGKLLIQSRPVWCWPKKCIPKCWVQMLVHWSEMSGGGNGQCEGHTADGGQMYFCLCLWSSLKGYCSQLCALPSVGLCYSKGAK